MPNKAFFNLYIIQFVTILQFLNWVPGKILIMSKLKDDLCDNYTRYEDFKWTNYTTCKHTDYTMKENNTKFKDYLRSFNLRNILVSVQFYYLAFLLILLDNSSTASGATTTTAAATTTQENTTTQPATKVTGSFSSYTEETDVPKAVIVVAGLFVFFVLAVLIAKLFDYCHDRRTISDDASDISDYTKELLKAQMMMLAFNRGRAKGKKLKPEEAALKYGKMWRAKMARNKARMMKVRKEAAQLALAAGADPEKAANLAAKEYDEKRIKAQIVAAQKELKNKDKGKNTDNKKETENKKEIDSKKEQTNKKDGTNNRQDTGISVKNIPVEMFTARDIKNNKEEKMSRPSTAKRTIELFTINETKNKVSDKSKVETKPQRPTTAKKGSSRPISAGLKRAVSRTQSSLSMNKGKK